MFQYKTFGPTNSQTYKVTKFFGQVLLQFQSSILPQSIPLGPFYNHLPEVKNCWILFPAVSFYISFGPKKL
jgi:hypothetical protein